MQQLKPIKVRRLDDLGYGLRVTRGTDLESLRQEASQLHIAIAAGQSLDDLGDGLNAMVQHTLEILLARYKQIDQETEQIKKNQRSSAKVTILGH